MTHSPRLIHTLCLRVLLVVRVVFGKVFLSLISKFMLFIPCVSLVKFLPVVLNLLIFRIFVGALVFPKLLLPLPTSYFIRIIFLSNIILGFRRKLYLQTSFTIVKSLEIGVIKDLLRHKPFSLSLYYPRLLQTIYALSPLRVVWLILFVLFFFFLIA